MTHILLFGKWKKQGLLCAIVFISFTQIFAQSFITEKKESAAFPVVSATAARLVIDEKDFWLVQKAGSFLQNDIQLVTGKKPEITSSLPSSGTVIIIGSLDKSSLIQRLAADNKINTASIKGKWEAFTLQVVPQPFPGVESALVIAGSDRRGTAFGVFELSQQMGVSPWYWWADVPVKKKAEVYVKKGVYTYNSPAVKYRGIFINDEAPAFSGWTKEKFGGVNHKAYEKMFELLLRMKANYLWPAMWGNAFNDDDTLNPVLADQYGIVMGTSHHEPMLRAQQEWKRYGSGAWNYTTNDSVLRRFWKKGIENMGSHESIVTIGMRGDGDEPMTQGTAIELLEKIVKDQRTIIQEVTGKAPSATPQLWALYKEVQDYYDKGMRVPDDVTLLLCDDNWGNIRKLPKRGEKPRAGGYGIYYHYDYVGGPRNYKWLNTNQISRVWEQMHLAHEYGANEIWIVNVGDLKPMEFPIEFFLDYAWSPDQWPANKLDDYTRQWAAKQFGETYAADIADILSKYTKYNSRRKPELLSPETYSLLNYREAETIVSDYKSLEQKAERIYAKIPADYKDAYYQLVLHPVQASANLNDLYVTTAKNRWYAAQGRALTNALADSVQSQFARDSAISYYYNHTMANGKWNHMMDQTHIGYTYWQQPPVNKMPEVKHIELPAAADMGVAVEGSEAWWPNSTAKAVLPAFNPYQPQAHFLEIFNRGTKEFNYKIASTAKWLQITPKKGKINDQQRVWITVNWSKAPVGVHQVPVTIQGAGKRVEIMVVVNNPASPKPSEIKGFVESNGYVSMEAVHFTQAVEANGIQWQVIPDLGRTLSAVTPVPVTAPAQTPGANSPRLEYQMYLFDTGRIKVQTYLSPTLDFHNTGGLRYAVSIDNEPPQIINMHEGNVDRLWNQWVADNIIIKTSQHQIMQPGSHVLKFWMVDPGVVLQKIVVDAGGVKQSYLGPPETLMAQNSGK